MSDDQVKLIAAIAAAASAILVAVLSAFLGRAFAGRDRRRQIYGEAFRAALEWQEMLFRVRRRDNTDEAERIVLDRFHDLQERLNYYEGWIGSESKYMRRSYHNLVDQHKLATRSLIQEAWDRPGRKGNADNGDSYPDPRASSDASDKFLRDVRNHLSIQPWRWLLVGVRNRKRG
ncbi:hypothetical protein [Amycolatopsis orientalis]|uniref:hypothetical protein n=1 Tax=Amycolatopsis orientalis TaxID=31958 RepID=UPI0011AB4620|nr:hypothetical protein [Amycolatopsis orientalis]